MIGGLKSRRAGATIDRANKPTQLGSMREESLNFCTQHPGKHPIESCNLSQHSAYSTLKASKGEERYMAERTKESEWIALALDGNDEAFALLVEAYQRPVFNLCFRMLGDAAEAEDAAQETFLKAYRGLSRYDPDRSFTTWLLSIASHHCIDRMRRRRFMTVSLDELLPSQERPDTAPGPEAALTGREQGEAIRELLKGLGSKDRAAVILRYWYEMSYEEISNTLSLSVSAVKSRLHRARREMAKQWIDKDLNAISTRGRRDEASAV